MCVGAQKTRTNVGVPNIAGLLEGPLEETRKSIRTCPKSCVFFFHLLLIDESHRSVFFFFFCNGWKVAVGGSVVSVFTLLRTFRAIEQLANMRPSWSILRLS